MESFTQSFQLSKKTLTLYCSVMASEDGLASVDCLQLAFEQELRLTLYRHWTLFESLLHSQYIACHFKVWTLKGRKRLHEYLADMGCVKKITSREILVIQKLNKIKFLL